jgi:Amt family ammonium transporter
VVATIAFVALASFGILYVLRAVMALRVTVDAEVSGIDLAEHGESAYHDADLSDLTGRMTSLSDAVVLSATELPRASRAA